MVPYNCLNCKQPGFLDTKLASKHMVLICMWGCILAQLSSWVSSSKICNHSYNIKKYNYRQISF